MSIEIFCCYAHEDQTLLNKLKAHLMPLQRGGLINIWADTDIGAGMEWEKEIEMHLDTAQIMLMLVSADFINSDYAYSKEMMRAIERHEQGEATVIPIILRPSLWHETPLGKLQALPKDANPVISWPNLDEALLSIAENISKIVTKLAKESALRIPSQAECRKTIEDLAQQYDLVRTQMDSSPERTEQMESIIEQLRILTPQAGFSSNEIKTYLESNDQGKRIVGLSLVESSPSADYFEQVLQLIQSRQSRTPFQQLRALLVMQKIVQSSQLDQKQKQHLQSVLENTSSINKEDTERKKVRDRLLSAL